MFLDYGCERLDTLDTEPTSADTRLCWVSGGAVEGAPALVSAFAFKPRYSYEFDAVDALHLRARDGGWFGTTEPNPDTCTALFEQLLEATIWRSRPVLDSEMVFWQALALGEGDYAHLKQLASASRSEPITVNGDNLYAATEQHNLQPAAFKLLVEDSSGHGWAFDALPLTLDATSDAPDTPALTINLCGAVNLWFMPDETLLIQWRLSPCKVVEGNALCRARPGTWRELLNTGVADSPMRFDDWIRMAQSFRWLRAGYAEQYDEGKKLDEWLLRSLIAPNGASNAVLPVALGRKLDTLLDDFLRNAGEPRAFSHLGLGVFSIDAGKPLNAAVERVFANTLSVYVWLDVVNKVADNYPSSADFTREWVAARRYDRWRDTGIQYGFSDYSSVAVGTSEFFTAQVLTQDFPGLYAHLVRLCLYQRSVLRDLSQRLAGDRVLQNTAQFQAARTRYQHFLQHGWFQYASDQVQPTEIWQGVARGMNLQPLFTDVRDEIADAGAYIDTQLDQQANTLEIRRNWIFAVAGLLIGLPGVLEMWREPGTFGFAQPLTAMLISTEFWLGAGVIVIVFAVFLLARQIRKAIAAARG